MSKAKDIEKNKMRAAYQRRYRKENPRYRQQENKRRRKERKHFTSRQIRKQRLQARLRKRVQRGKKKLELETNRGIAYSTPNSATRAVRKVLQAVNENLPHSPLKRAFVKSSVGSRLLDVPLISSQPRDNKTKSIPPEVRTLVTKFYENDDMSTDTPGQKQFVRVGDKQIQKVIQFICEYHIICRHASRCHCMYISEVSLTDCKRGSRSIQSKLS